MNFITEFFGDKKSLFNFLKGIGFIIGLGFATVFFGNIIANNAEKIGYHWLFFGFLWAIFYFTPAKSIYRTCKMIDMDCNSFLINFPIYQELCLDKLLGATNAPKVLVSSRMLLVSTILTVLCICGCFIPLEVVMSFSIKVLKYIVLIFIIARGIYTYNLAILVNGKMKSLIMCIIFPFQIWLLTTLNKKIEKRKR